MATLQEVVAETAETKEYSVPASFENHSQNIELDTLPSLLPTASPSDLEQTFHENTDTTVTRNEISHAPVDGGLEAWSFLAAAFAVDAIVWSFPFAFGVFLSVYLKDPRWISQKHAYTLLPLTGTLSTGLIYCSGAFINPLLGRYPQYRRMAIWCGAVMCGSSLLAASFASDVIYLVVTQGCLYGIGGGLTYYPTLSFMQEWFVRRRGLANGVIFTGTSIAGLFLPLVLPRIISSHGTSLTLRYFAISISVALAIVIPFIKPRLPVQTVHGPRTRSSEKPWLKDWTWWFVLLMNTVQGFAHFVPVVWLPTYTSALNASASTASLSLALLNAATAIGQFSMGLLSDHFSPWPLATITLSCCSLATFILWGVAGYAVAGILVYGTCFGILAGGFSSLYTGFVKPIAKDDTLLSVQLFGFLLFSRGLGNVLSTPISTALSASTHIIAHQRTGFDVDGGRYEKMIIYVGSCLAGAAAVALGGWMRERIGR